MPDSKPAGVSVKPQAPGSPALTDHVYGAVPPAAAKACEKATPTSAGGGTRSWPLAGNAGAASGAGVGVGVRSGVIQGDGTGIAAGVNMIVGSGFTLTLTLSGALGIPSAPVATTLKV